MLDHSVMSRLSVTHGLYAATRLHSVPGDSQAGILGGFPFPSPRDLPDVGIEPASLRVLCVGRWILYHLSHLGNPGGTQIRTQTGGTGEGKGEVKEEKRAETGTGWSSSTSAVRRVILRGTGFSRRLSVSREFELILPGLLAHQP